MHVEINTNTLYTIAGLCHSIAYMKVASCFCYMLFGKYESLFLIDYDSTELMENRFLLFTMCFSEKIYNYLMDPLLNFIHYEILKYNFFRL